MGGGTHAPVTINATPATTSLQFIAPPPTFRVILRSFRHWRQQADRAESAPRRDEWWSQGLGVQSPPRGLERVG
jgi:hypothetical protein